MLKHLAFIQDMYDNGLTVETIARNRDIFSGITLIINKRGNCIEANGVSLHFNEQENKRNFFICYSTTASFPDDKVISLLVKENFHKIIVDKKSKVI